jgi:hypothetical protein
MARLGSGDYFGERAFTSSDHVHETTAITTTACVFYTITFKEFQSLTSPLEMVAVSSPASVLHRLDAGDVLPDQGDVEDIFHSMETAYFNPLHTTLSAMRLPEKPYSVSLDHKENFQATISAPIDSEHHRSESWTLVATTPDRVEAVQNAKVLLLQKHLLVVQCRQATTWQSLHLHVGPVSIEKHNIAIRT